MRHATLVHPKEEKAEFEECDTCKVKPGSPDLCQGCVRNRLLIERLSKAEVKKGRWELRSETIDKEIEQFLDVGWEPFQCVHIDGELIVYLKRFIPVE